MGAEARTEYKEHRLGPRIVREGQFASAGLFFDTAMLENIFDDVQYAFLRS